MTSNTKRCRRNSRMRALSIIHLEHRWRRFQQRTCHPCYPSRLVLYNHCWPHISLSFYSISIDRILLNICFSLYVKISFNKRIRPVNSVISMEDMEHVSLSVCHPVEIRYDYVMSSVLSVASVVNQIRERICHNRDYLGALWSRYRPCPSGTGSMPCHCLLPMSRWVIKFDTNAPLNECQRYSEDPFAYLFMANTHLSLCRQEMPLRQIRNVSFHL